MSPIIHECSLRNTEFFIIHTGQHYSYNLDSVFFVELGLPAPKHNLMVGSQSFPIQLGKMMQGIDCALKEEAPDFVLAEGDTNSVLATALVASHRHIPFVHVEAGLRSYNPAMQEETNRTVSDHVAGVLLPPTPWSRDILINEGINREKIFVTGNTIVDAVNHYLPQAETGGTLPRFGLQPKGYFLATLHRAENADDDRVLRHILLNFGQLSELFQVPLVFPVHPRTRARMEALELSVPPGVQLVEPVGFYDFLALEKNALLVLTDSGGAQEECCILQVPCITLRDDTERPETIHVGGNKLVGRMPHSLADDVREMLDRPRTWSNPFGDGRAARRTIDALVEVASR